MKTFIKIIGMGATVFLVAYLIGAFVFADLNISNWTLVGRAVVGFVGVLLGLSVMGAWIDTINNR